MVCLYIERVYYARTSTKLHFRARCSLRMYRKKHAGDTGHNTSRCLAASTIDIEYKHFIRV
jgi:hypothetical protein